jgi:outer membrane protein TolC
MVEAGNFNKLDLARERFFYAEAAVGLAKAEQVKTIAYERLTRLMGLKASERKFQLPEHLPALPDGIVEQSNIEQTAMEQRLDLQAMQGETASLAKRLGLTKTTRFIDVLELGPARVLEGKRSDPYKNGVFVSLEIPMFDWGTARVARAEAIYMQSVNQLAAMAINAQSEVREKYAIYQSSYEIAKRYRDEIIPLSKKISDENQLRYNGMFVSVFDLLSDANSQIRNVNAHIDALRAFWIAQVEMEMTLIGGELPTESLN